MPEALLSEEYSQYPCLFFADFENKNLTLFLSCSSQLRFEMSGGNPHHRFNPNARSFVPNANAQPFVPGQQFQIQQPGFGVSSQFCPPGQFQQFGGNFQPHQQFDRHPTSPNQSVPMEQQPVLDCKSLKYLLSLFPRFSLGRRYRGNFSDQFGTKNHGRSCQTSGRFRKRANQTAFKRI